jgi:hypothetical protein
MKIHTLAPGLTIFALCLAVLASHFHTIDEGSMFVTAVNIVNHGELHTNQLGWAQWANRPGEEQGLVSESGDVYSKKSPIVIALLVPLVALGRWFGAIRMALLFGPLVTALTGTLLYRMAIKLGYSSAVSAVMTFTFGLGTMALPYSKLAMGELAASFGLLLALSTFVPAASAAPGDQKRLKSLLRIEIPSFLCGIGLALAIGANVAYVSLIPIFAFAIFVQQRSPTAIVSFGLPIALIGLTLAGYNYLRFGNVLQTGYHLAPGQEGFTTPLWWGVLGLTVSPARGLLWYNPPVLVALLGWPRFHRAHRSLSWIIIAVVALHLLIFGTWWQWWGGYGWGPRFLLPIVPCLMLASLPLLKSQGRLLRLIAIGLILASVVVQIGGTVIDFNIYENELEAQFPAPKDQPLYYHHDPALVYEAARSPIVVHLQRLPTAIPDFAWWPGAWTPASIPNILNTLQSSPSAGTAILYLAPELIDPLVVTSNLPPTYGLPVNVSPTDALAQRLFARALRDPNRIWLITWYGPADPGNWYEARLREKWAAISEETLDGYRLLQLARPPAQPALHPINVRFGSIRLSRYATQIENGTLFVELHWQTDNALPENYMTFVHVLSADRSLVAGQDRQPLGGYRSTSAWQPGEVIVDRFAFSLDQPEGLNVEVGWYSWPSLERLPVTNATGQRLESDSQTLSIDP